MGNTTIELEKKLQSPISMKLKQLQKLLAMVLVVWQKITDFNMSINKFTWW